MKPINYKRAGKLMLTKYINGVLNRSAANSCFRNGPVQSIVPTMTMGSTALADGNSDWDAADIDTNKSGALAVTFTHMPPALYAFLMGVSVESLVNSTFTEVDAEIVIPDVSAFMVTLDHTPTGSNEILVDADASAWAKTASVSAVPAQGQYTVSASALIFNSADAGKSVYITYDWTALTASSFGLPKAGSSSVMQAIISGDAIDEDENPYNGNLVIDRCKVTGDIKPVEMSKEPKPVTINLKVLKPRGSNKAVDFKYAPKS